MRKRNTVLIIFIWIAILVLFYVRPVKLVQEKHEYMNYIHYGLAEIEKENIIQQEFYANGNYLKGIELFFANFSPENKEKVYLQITDSNNRIIWEKKIPFRKIENGEMSFFSINRYVAEGEAYYLEITVSEESENAEAAPRIMLSLPQYNLLETGECYKGMDLQDQNVAITYYWAEAMPFECAVIIVSSIAVIVLLILRKHIFN